VTGGIYYTAAENTIVVGLKLASFLLQLKLNFNKIHCIGHSLGAHCCGFIGKMKQIDRITGQYKFLKN
jgi:hypothetical protein